MLHLYLELMHIHNCKLVATSAQFVKFQIASELKRFCFTDKQNVRQLLKIKQGKIVNKTATERQRDM